MELPIARSTMSPAPTALVAEAPLAAGQRWLMLWPAVLVLSLPRSGSSWTGEALGCAIDALYLREPVTQSDRHFYDRGTVFPIDTPDLDARYRHFASKAYSGCRDFDHSIVRFPDQWDTPRTTARRVVIKEVNPRACGWYLQHYAPRIVLLVRHPAAVALSWQRKGWLGADANSWARNGEHQGRALREALDSLIAYPAHRVVLYEDLCADPVTFFQSLFVFAGLTWETGAEQFIVERTCRDDDRNTCDTSRDSRQMIHCWRTKAVQENVTALGGAFSEFNLPWYRHSADWQV